VTIAVLDTHCEDDWLEAMKTAVASSLEVLPPESLFGLISFGDRVRIQLDLFIPMIVLSR